MTKIKPTLGLFETTLYGIGIILGAGIYALVGIGAGVAGNALWLAFLIGAIIAAFTGLSYAELSSMYPKDAAEYVYTRKAFGKDALAFCVQWIMLFTITVSAAAVSLGFAGYWKFLFGGNATFIALLLIAAMALLNYFGIRESAKYNDFSTILEASGLIGIIGLGIYYMAKHDLIGSFDYLSSPTGIPGIFAATSIIYFAFIGFENLVNFSEEVKNPKKTIPLALLLSLAISSIIYMLVSIAAVGIMGWESLSLSSAPLAEAAEKVIPNGSLALSFIALFATSNTVLILLIVGSRLLYGLSSNRQLPQSFSKIGKRGTPSLSVVTVALFSGLVLLYGGIKDLAHLTDLGIFLVYLMVNLSLIVLRYREPNAARPFRAPLNVGNFPIPALLGIFLNVGMLYFFDLKTFMMEIALILVGLFAYMVFSVWVNKKSVKKVGS